MLQAGRTGKVRVFRRRRRCSAVRIICVVCKTTVIHKNSKQAESRICEACE